ncbi:hypothetical protein AVEN_253503-1 [Araneus ventricosus]|uniref:Mos1 transposase HTH domain-containing protein n=1 Tax=Araneus ventricosus TaxID=182803 RepID=A0A4Y2BT92_ARAVE|nr:hypothetical protein AVEN_253503-1 [Araneus ventricosus]
MTNPKADFGPHICGIPFNEQNAHGRVTYKGLKEVYGEQCLARCTICRWYQSFEAGRVNIKDLPRPVQAHVVSNRATISAVDELIRLDRRITTSEIAVELSISKGTVHHIIHKKLGYGKVCAQWVHKLPSENQTTARWCTGSVSNPGVSTLKPTTLLLCAGISVSLAITIIYSCTVPHEL